ncbi:MAG: hypothetical protein HC771_01425 [Synechococcales cyanobacterium CRU_2_2]|nr:hypothetical protein [Synechococcales cyanobacterium CRU_2_2]
MLLQRPLNPRASRSPRLQHLRFRHRNQELSHWVQTQAQLYAHCFGSAAQALTAYEVSEETIRAAASTLFISASRKFNLER